MGGLVTRAYLLKNRDVAIHTVLAYFFSTPTTGSDLASLIQYLADNPQFGEMETLQPADYLANLLRQWLAAGFSFPSYCAYEKRPTYGMQIVTMQSASALCTRALDPIDADHISIVKPTSESSPSYIAFKAAYKSVMENQTKSSTSPDVTMRLVGPKRPALVLENISDTVAYQIKYALALLKIGSGLPVAIPIGTFDFLRPHDQGGPLNLFDSPAVLHTVHEGDKMFGWIQISCPLCLLTHYFYAYIDFGHTGWYAEVTKDRHEQIVKWLRDNGPYSTDDADDADRIVSVIPPGRRIHIQ
jgi:hypothetical protein